MMGTATVNGTTMGTFFKARSVNMKVKNPRNNLLTIALFAACVLFVRCDAWSEEQDHDHEGHAHDEAKAEKGKPNHADNSAEHDDHDHAQEHEEKGKGEADTHGEDEHGDDDHAEAKGGHDEHGHGGEDDHGEEGVISISVEALEAAKIEVDEVKPATLHSKLKVNGRLAPVSSKVAHITSRFAGVVKEVRKDIGDEVKAGEVLAVVESNQNLHPFEVRTLKAGLVTERHATLGEFASEGSTLFVIADFSELWADFTVFQRDVPKVKVGQALTLLPGGGISPIQTTVSFISPIVDETTQSRIARAVISNATHALAPGAFVTGEIAVGEYQVPAAVTYEAIQTIEGKTVVFVQEADKFEKREVSVGRSDGELVEITAGLKPGEKYAASNTFTLKAELGKSEAEHEH